MLVARPADGLGGARRVSDTFVDSSWYLLRYPSAEFNNKPWLLPADFYASGPEPVQATTFTGALSPWRCTTRRRICRKAEQSLRIPRAGGGTAPHARPLRPKRGEAARRVTSEA